MLAFVECGRNGMNGTNHGIILGDHALDLAVEGRPGALRCPTQHCGNRAEKEPGLERLEGLARPGPCQPRATDVSLLHRQARHCCLTFADNYESLSMYYDLASLGLHRDENAAENDASHRRTHMITFAPTRDRPHSRNNPC